MSIKQKFNAFALGLLLTGALSPSLAQVHGGVSSVGTINPGDIATFKNKAQIQNGSGTPTSGQCYIYTGTYPSGSWGPGSCSGGASGPASIQLVGGTNISITPSTPCASGACSFTINYTGSGGGVTSFNTRTGAVVPAINDYSFSLISGTLGCTQLPTFTGAVTNSNCAMSLASGAASSNIGTLGGVLGGTLPNPTMAAGAASANIGSLGGALGGTLPNPTLNIVPTATGGTNTNNGTNSAGDLLMSTAANGNFVHTALNAVCSLVPSVCTLAFGYTNIKWYGALCNGGDDITAIRNAVSASYGGLLFFPCISSVSSDVVLTQPISFEGAGMYTSGLIALSSIGSTLPVLLIEPPTGTTSRGYSFNNMAFVNGFGAQAVEIFSAFTSTSIAEVVFDKVETDAASSNASNYAVELGNSSNPNGGIFNFTYKNGIISGGVFLVSVGDTLRFQNNIITGPNAGIAGNQVSGAGNLIITDNNITSTGGGVVLACGIGTVISHNEFEQQVTSTEANNAIIDLTASLCTSNDIWITENQIQADSAAGTPLLINIASNNVFVKLDSNRFGTPTPYTGIANASASLLCGNNNFITGPTHVSGTAPVGTWSNGC